MIIANAKAEALALVENQRAESLAALYAAAGINSTADRASFNYIRALRENKKAKIYFNFQNLQARPWLLIGALIPNKKLYGYFFFYFC